MQPAAAAATLPAMRFAYERSLPGASLRLFSLDSEVLRDNPLGDPALRHCPVLVPEAGGEGLPLVLILVGFTGSGPRVLNVSLFEENLPERLARLMAEGTLPPAVYLWPSCETRYGGSQYLNSEATGRYEDFVVDELTPRVEEAFGCGGEGRRLAAGKSSGGYGVLRLAMQRPGWLSAVACHAGDMGFEMGYAGEVPGALATFRKAGGVRAFLDRLPRLEGLGGGAHAALDLVAMASCYSPAPGTELGFELPVEPETGEPRPEVIARWLEHDPLRMVEQPARAEGLRRLRALYLDAGEADEFALQWGLRRFLRRLDRLGIPYRAEFFEGGHFGMDPRYEVSLPWLFERLGA